MAQVMKKYPYFCRGKKQAYPEIKTGETLLSSCTVIGNLIFASGVTARSTDTGKLEATNIEEQTQAIYENIEQIMEAAGSSIKNVVKDMVLFKDLDDYTGFRKAQLEYFIEHVPTLAKDPPCSSIFQPHSLSDPNVLVEIEVIGVVDRNKPGDEVTMFPAIYSGVKFAHPHVSPGHAIFSKSVIVDNLLFCSGMAGLALNSWEITSENLEDQMQISRDKINKNMEQAGTNMNNIFKVVNLLKRVEEYPRMMSWDKDYYKQHDSNLAKDPPAHTFIQCNLHLPKHLVETEALAVVDSNRPGYDIKNYPLYYGNSREPFARSVSVGGLIFTSGIDAKNPDTGKIELSSPEGQMKTVLDKVCIAMEEAGGSLDTIAKTTMLIKNWEDYASLRKMEQEYYQEHAPHLLEEPPATTTIQLSSLTQPKGLVEIEVTGITK